MGRPTSAKFSEQTIACAFLEPKAGGIEDFGEEEGSPPRSAGVLYLDKRQDEQSSLANECSSVNDSHYIGMMRTGLI